MFQGLAERPRKSLTPTLRLSLAITSCNLVLVRTIGGFCPASAFYSTTTTLRRWQSENSTLNAEESPAFRVVGGGEACVFLCVYVCGMITTVWLAGCVLCRQDRLSISSTFVSAAITRQCMLAPMRLISNLVFLGSSDYRTVSGVNGPLVILDNIKVRLSSHILGSFFLRGAADGL